MWFRQGTPGIPVFISVYLQPAEVALGPSYISGKAQVFSQHSQGQKPGTTATMLPKLMTRQQWHP